jgi:poly(A) polymerase
VVSKTAIKAVFCGIWAFIQPFGAKFIELALAKTDERVRLGKSVSPGFLFAVLLWPQVIEKWRNYRDAGENPIPALHASASDVFGIQTEKLALHRRIISDMRDIWVLQPRFERRAGKSAYRLLQNERFRAAYDFLLLRCEAGEIDTELGNWWTTFIHADNAERENMLSAKQATTKSGSRKKRRSGKRRNKTTTELSTKSVET